MTNVRHADPIEPPKRVREMATQTVRPLKPLVATTDATTLSTAAAPNLVNDALAETQQRMSKIEEKLNKLTRNKPDWPSLSSSVDLLGARQELILTKLDTIRNRQISVNNTNDDSVDSDVSSLGDNLWGPVTPEEDPCYEGAALCQCRHQEL